MRRAGGLHPSELYAYRPGRNAQQAVVEVEELLFRGHPEVVDADLADYFGSIPHAELLKSVARRIVDRRVGFHDAEEEARREAGRAFIPVASRGVAGLWRVNGELLRAVQAQRPVAQATLDMDATLIETHKREALYCYKHFKAYQPLNTWWAEGGLIVRSEFRDGNVSAGHEQLRVLEEECSSPGSSSAWLSAPKG